jgi:seryl-tRNA synthetase
MGRIEKMKRLIIEESNKRNLGIIKEDDELRYMGDKLSSLEGEARGIEGDIEDVAYDLHAKLDDDYEDDDDTPEELMDIYSRVHHAYELANDTGDELDTVSYDIDDYLLDLDDEEEDDIPVGKSDMDKHLRDKDGRMGSL